jgi:hypothetical protein
MLGFAALAQFAVGQASVEAASIVLDWLTRARRRARR